MKKQAGDEEARDLLISEYWPLVRCTIRRVIPAIPSRIDEDDLVGECTIALAKAIDRFDLARGVQPESFLISMVRGAALEYLRKEDWLPRSVRTKQKLLKAAEERVVLRIGREGTQLEIAAELGMSLDDTAQLQREALAPHMFSLEDLLHVGDDYADVDPLMVREALRSQEPDPADTATEAIETEALWQFVGWLPLPERRVVHAYYVLGKSLKQIAHDMGRSESRAHQLHTQAIARLQGMMAVAPQEKAPQGGKLRDAAARGLLVRDILADEPLPLTRERREEIAAETGCEPASVQRIAKLVEAGRPQSEERWAA